MDRRGLMSIVPALGGYRKEGKELKVILDYNNKFS